MIYPETPRGGVVESRFGISIADPYRWLEGDTRTDESVATWIKAQDDLARSYLAGLAGGGMLRTRLSALFDHERLTAPVKRAGSYFFTRNSGLDDQPVLVMRQEGDGIDRVLIDPAAWSEDGAAALAEWSVSEDARFVAFARQDGGSEWRTIHVLDVESGTLMSDRIEWARFTSIAWLKDGSGFFYSRFPATHSDGEGEGSIAEHSIHFHALGTTQSSDRLVLPASRGQPLIQTLDVTTDGRYAFIYSSPGAGSNALSIIDLEVEDWEPLPIVEVYGNNWSVVGNRGTLFFLATDHGAERGRIVTYDIADSSRRFIEVVGEDVVGTLNDAILLGGRLLVTYLIDNKAVVRRHLLDGTGDGIIWLPGVGTVGGFKGHPDDDEVFFVFTSYNAPTTIYVHDVTERTVAVWAEPAVAADLDAVTVEQHFYHSRDGTRIPLSVIRRRDAATPAPTILYGYGGYGISMLPYYSPAILAWVEAGGAYAVASLRGGGEYGKAWHDAGRLANKQNVFDDFAAAAEYLKDERIAAKGGLVVQGESNGGLLVAAVVNQRPDLFAAALPGVGVMDMLRFARFTNGRFWLGDFGDPDKETDFRNLATYSPYHNIRSGEEYPAILVTTADTDDRVVPAHSFKYVAALQAADLGDRPRILRVDKRAGHGSGKPIRKAIDEVADLWAFAARWSGLELHRPGR